MTGLWVAVLVVIGLAASVARAVMGGMLREEAQTRLSRIPYALIRLAAARVPRELRDDLAAEWNAELGFFLTGTDGLPITRFIRGIRYSAGLLLSARDISDGLTHGDSRHAAPRVRFAVGMIIATISFPVAVSGVISAIYPRPGADPSLAGSIAVTCWALSTICIGIGVAWNKPRAFPAIGAGFTAIATYVALYLDHGGVSDLLYAAAFLLVPLVAVVLAVVMRRHPRQARAIHDALFAGCTECFPAKPEASEPGKTGPA